MLRHLLLALALVATRGLPTLYESKQQHLRPETRELEDGTEPLPDQERSVLAWAASRAPGNVAFNPGQCAVRKLKAEALVVTLNMKVGWNLETVVLKPPVIDVGPEQTVMTMNQVLDAYTSYQEPKTQTSIQ